MITVENREVITRLRSEIASNVAKSRELRAEANAVRGIERHKINLQRRDLGTETRHRLLLLAYLRERPYLTVERSCRVAPWTHRMASIYLNVPAYPQTEAMRLVWQAIDKWVAEPAEGAAAASPVEHAGVAA